MSGAAKPSFQKHDPIDGIREFRNIKSVLVQDAKAAPKGGA